MKRAQLCILVLVICLSLCACGSDAQEGTSSTNSTAPYFTPELTFEPSNDLTSYVVTGLSGIPQSMDIVIPATYQGHPVTEIAVGAFREVGLTSISIPDSVTSIGNAAFDGCSSLTSITIPDSVTSIGRTAFSDCTGLQEIVLSENANFIFSDGILYNKPVTEIIWVSTRISRDVTILDGVTSIGDYKFYNRKSLTSITIPRSVTSIGECAFYGCISLTDIHFDGTKNDWYCIKQGWKWNDGTGNYTIYCTDGKINK